MTSSMVICFFLQIVRHFFDAIVLSPDLVPYRFLNLIVDPYSISKFVLHVFLQFVMTAFSREQMMTVFLQCRSRNHIFMFFFL